MPRADAVPALLAFLLVAVLGFDQGGFAAPSWGWSAVLLATLAVALFRARGSRPGPLEVAFLVALAGLLVWTLLSAWWSLDSTGSILEAERMLLYLSAGAALLLLGRPAARGPMLAGALAAIALVSLRGLADKLVGDDPVGAASADPGSQLRLSEPLGYANALGLLAAMGILLALGLAVRSTNAWTRALYGGLVPPLLATIYFTLGRGAWVSLGVGLAAALGVSTRLSARYALALGAAALAGAALLVAGAGGPVALARDAYDSFTAPTTPAAEGGSRLLTLSGSSRVDYWSTALEDVADHPVLGSGAGSYGRYWLRHRPVREPALDAHSLYLETLAELGPLGLALLLTALGLPVAAAVRARGDSLTAAALGPYAAYLAHAAQDWDWEMPAVTVAAVVCAASLLVSRRPTETPLGGRIPAAAAVLLAVVAAGAYAGNRELVLAEGGSERAARRAARLQPWSGEPWRLRGEVQLSRGDVAAARSSFLEGLDRDDDEWELWLDLALVTEGEERRRALDRAEELNPLAPEIDELSAEG